MPNYPDTSKARGYFFAALEVQPYQPNGVLFGQYLPDSCVAACCRMLLVDAGVTVSEAELRTWLDDEKGAFISRVPSVLQQFGLSAIHQYRNDLSFDELRQAVTTGPALVFVTKPRSKAGHALLVDQIKDGLVAIRDPLPELEGKAYRVGVSEFLTFWLHSNGRGQAAIAVR
ncbi:MAG: hypothetical protein HYR56_19845 [Acidobacteria bacterium]|nr:hypothetical protein [Acidobacteriota bacterium]MBI3421897.1 hypothetical protein [Acidobacteriota bacterium]